MSAISHALSHVAVSVPPGTLTAEYRKQVLAFYGPLLGWHEIEGLRLDDRMTIAVGTDCYVNLRERGDDVATYRGYDHFGVLVGSEAELRELWTELDTKHPDVTLRAISGSGRALTFRMQHLLPVALEVQYFG
jgi:hypothetical protein